MFLAALVTLVATCNGDDQESDDAKATRRCEQLRDHVIDLRLADATQVDVERHRTAMRAALGGDFIASCKTTLSASQITCALDAPDRESIDACSSGTATAK